MGHAVVGLRPRPGLYASSGRPASGGGSVTVLTIRVTSSWWYRPRRSDRSESSTPASRALRLSLRPEGCLVVVQVHLGDLTIQAVLRSQDRDPRPCDHAALVLRRRDTAFSPAALSPPYHHRRQPRRSEVHGSEEIRGCNPRRNASRGLGARRSGRSRYSAPHALRSR
jgi:hypothetical protein